MSSIHKIFVAVAAMTGIEYAPNAAVTRAHESGPDAARRFFHELLMSVETLTGIAEEHGSQTLADLLYLQQAILTGTCIDVGPDTGSNVDAVVGRLPSCARWRAFMTARPVGMQ
jgi:hypothetical protein